jgi:NTP pyrophosphatase (non-canonical NTP hydrolase)
MKNPMPHPVTLDAITAEVMRARTKFPGNAKLLAALTEEVGELAKAMLQRRPKDEIEKEAIQVACVAVRILEEGDSDFGRDKEWSDAP